MVVLEKKMVLIRVLAQFGQQRLLIMPSSYSFPSFPCFVPPSSCRQQQSVCVAAIRGLTECLPLCKAFVRYAFCALNGLSTIQLFSSIFLSALSLLGHRHLVSYGALASWRDLPASSQIGHTLKTVFFPVSLGIGSYGVHDRLKPSLQW